jgi:hypothetical protein
MRTTADKAARGRKVSQGVVPVRGHSQIGLRAGNIRNEVQLRWGDVSSRAEASKHSGANHHQLFGSLVDAAAALVASGRALHGRGPARVWNKASCPSVSRLAVGGLLQTHTTARFGLEVAPIGRRLFPILLLTAQTHLDTLPNFVRISYDSHHLSHFPKRDLVRMATGPEPYIPTTSSPTTPSRPNRDRPGAAYGVATMDDRDVARFDQGDGVEGVTSPPAPRQAEKIRMFFHKQLVAEVKAIYARLAMVESKCIEGDKALRPQYKPGDNPRHHLIALYGILLYKPSASFLASQHPSASPAPGRLAAKSAMPAHVVSTGVPFSRHDRAGSLGDSKNRRYGLLPRPCLWLFIANTIDMLDVTGWQSKPAATRRGVGRAGREPQAERRNAVPTTT